MAACTVVNRDGSITIPAHIREMYGIKEGAEVQCVINGYQIELRITASCLPELTTTINSGYGLISSQMSSIDPHTGI
ncbi:AbrB/MazE/SpoVT family DNA-binding domain-containing protein [Duganella qianjiadongensis]|uniref:SpoVT-AbrB domain-containing protein n=1 Tax=Duganella qianjiadongensis TaxID=2692176 RepID=A0ABW9VGA7_9BURK|nr:AbrB/MazE/SpoVT family DNA-binding domain-containing protein [Duganella qianjiadongensis]MYM38546.1 hypothetical protein [Duganella qianjiadongensis]